MWHWEGKNLIRLEGQTLNSTILPNLWQQTSRTKHCIVLSRLGEVATPVDSVVCSLSFCPQCRCLSVAVCLSVGCGGEVRSYIGRMNESYELSNSNLSTSNLSTPCVAVSYFEIIWPFLVFYSPFDPVYQTQVRPFILRNQTSAKVKDVRWH